MKLLVLFSTLLFIPLSFAQSRVHVQASLSPAGSFTAISNKLQGFAEKKGNQLTATELIVPVGSLSTDNDLRDEHLQKRLGGAKGQVVVKKITASDGQGHGTIVINGKEKEIPFTYSETPQGVKAKFTLLASHYGINDMSYMGVGVDDELVVEAWVPVR